MTIFGQDRASEIEKVQRKLANVIRAESITLTRNLSYVETYAAAIRAVEDLAGTPTEEIRFRARRVSAKCGLSTDWAADAYQRQREGLEGTAIQDVRVERARQIAEEGWTPEHDDAHDDGVLARAGACYAMDALSDWHVEAPGEWPFDSQWWKPTTARRDLVKAAALIVAEIERLDRQEGQGNG